MNSKHASALLRTFIRAFFSHYKYLIPFWLALAVFLVVAPLLLGFGRALAGPGGQIEAVKHIIASLMGPLLAVYDPTVIAVFSAAIVAAMTFDEVRWGVAEHILCAAPLSIGRLIMLKPLIGALLMVPMALCIVAARILFIYLLLGPQYLGYVAPLHVVLLARKLVHGYTSPHSDLQPPNSADLVEVQNSLERVGWHHPDNPGEHRGAQSPPGAYLNHCGRPLRIHSSIRRGMHGSDYLGLRSRGEDGGQDSPERHSSVESASFTASPSTMIPDSGCRHVRRRCVARPVVLINFLCEV